MKVYKENNIPSEGEIFISEYFKYENIKFEQEVVINNLQGDSKKYRKADFFLPEYKMYVEFFGMWNSTKEDRARYREKKQVFYKNKIPCVYLYPENLGIIQYSFYKRIIAELERNSMKKELFLFRIKRFLYDSDNQLAIFLILIILFIMMFGDFSLQEDKGSVTLFISVAIYQAYKLLQGYFKYFKKVYFVLNN